jgi:hypothetical protein
MYPTEGVSRSLGPMDFAHRGWSWFESPIAQLAGRIGDRPLVPRMLHFEEQRTTAEAAEPVA